MSPRSLVLALTGLCCLVSCTQPNNEGLVAWWKFDEGSGFRIADATGNGNRGAIHNGGWGEGVHGSALQMDGGNNSIVIIPLTEDLRSTAAQVTVMAWAYRIASHNVDLVGHGYPGLFFGYHGDQFKWQLVNSRGEVMDCYADPRYRAELHTWHHLAATYDGAAARLYLNGEEICQRPMTGSIVMPDGPFTISGYFSAGGRIIDEISGRIDEVRVFNRALGPAEIRAWYRSERSGGR